MTSMQVFFDDTCPLDATADHEETRRFGAFAGRSEVLEVKRPQRPRSAGNGPTIPVSEA